jgi:hypothetical protein
MSTAEDPFWVMAGRTAVLLRLKRMVEAALKPVRRMGTLLAPAPLNSRALTSKAELYVEVYPASGWSVEDVGKISRVLTLETAPLGDQFPGVLQRELGAPVKLFQVKFWARTGAVAKRARKSTALPAVREEKQRTLMNSLVGRKGRGAETHEERSIVSPSRFPQAKLQSDWEGEFPSASGSVPC